MLKSVLLLISSMMSAQAAVVTPTANPIPVNVDNFTRAETDTYFAKTVNEGGFGKLQHDRLPASIDDQKVVRMNRDTLYSSGVFDLSTGPLTIMLPSANKRFVSMQVISEDHYVVDIAYGPGTRTYDQAKVGTRYVFVIIRTLVNPQKPDDVDAAHKVQDSIQVAQKAAGRFEVPHWDPVTQDKARDALSALGSLGGIGVMFGTKQEVDPISHLIGAAIGWGGNPPYAATYVSGYPLQNDGKTIYSLNVKDVPVDGFWSISVYNSSGFFEKNSLNAYSLNNLTAKGNADGSYTVQFGGCSTGRTNCLPIVAGWNYTVRLYRPRKPILDGSWTFPEAKPLH
ncbi:DUF1254 domain-containing protein [Pseudomonas mohnii]